MKNDNPLSPHIQIYNWHISSLVSIGHRITGIINLIIFTIITFWIGSLLLAENYYYLIFNFFNSFFGKFFIIGTIYNLSNDVGNASWMSFWKNYLYVHIVVSLFIIVWFTLGGLNDLKVMLTKLKTEYRDHQDDGWEAKEKT